MFFVGIAGWSKTGGLEGWRYVFGVPERSPADDSLTVLVEVELKT